jgi:hypothetical protein
MALGHKEQAARHALGQVLQRGPLSTTGLGSSQQLRERVRQVLFGWALFRCWVHFGPTGTDVPFLGEIRGSVNAVLCRKEQQSRIHMLAHAHGRPNGSSDIQREQSFLSRIALKPTSRVLCPSGCSHDLHALVAASREPLRSNTLYPVVVCSEYQGSVTTSRRPSKASASLHKGVTRCLVWGRPPGQILCPSYSMGQPTWHRPIHGCNKVKFTVVMSPPSGKRGCSLSPSSRAVIA